jgi:hypothetical protein
LRATASTVTFAQEIRRWASNVLAIPRLHFTRSLLMRARLLLAVAALMALSVPASAQTTITPTFRAEQTYFHCHGQTKLANAEYATASTLPSWNTTKPTASVTSGAGCGWADTSALRSPQAGNSPHDGAWMGTFTGNLKSLTVEVHSISAGPGRAGGPQTFNATLFVDGVSMFGLAADGRANRAAVTVTPVVSSSQASSSYTFTIDRLPFATEDGDGTKTREIILNLAASSEPLMGWVYDTSEVPSGITFNPAAAKGPVIRATP